MRMSGGPAGMITRWSMSIRPSSSAYSRIHSSSALLRACSELLEPLLNRVRDREADPLVQPPRRLIIAVDVDMRDTDCCLAQPTKRREEDRAAQAEAVEIGVDTERFDLALEAL